MGRVCLSRVTWLTDLGKGRVQDVRDAAFDGLASASSRVGWSSVGCCGTAATELSDGGAAGVSSVTEDVPSPGSDVLEFLSKGSLSRQASRRFSCRARLFSVFFVGGTKLAPS